MKIIPLIIVTLLVIVAVFASWFIATSETLSLKGASLVNAEIAIIASLGGLISATFVISSFLHTNESFIESQRPQLLIQVNYNNNFVEPYPNNPNQNVRVATIFYRNVTRNIFHDLTINITVSAQNKVISLNHLFTPKMTMVGTDERYRKLNTFQELKVYSLNIHDIALQGNAVLLSVGYSYTFNGHLDEIDVNTYRWDTESMTWIIV